MSVSGTPRFRFTHPLDPLLPRHLVISVLSNAFDYFFFPRYKHLAQIYTMSTEQEKLQAEIDKMSMEINNLREQVIANNAKRLNIDMGAPIENEDLYEDALRTRIEEDEQKDYRVFAENLKRSIQKDDDENTRKRRKNGGLGHKRSGRKLSGHKLSGRKHGRKLSQRKQKRSRQTRR